ncbi:MAG TPA: hypothetical protein VND54_02720 [Candidatus Saccharimonadales bacterium]|nr:hypothetical protein [Candidatus Saccharimonadales bacterium]
MLADASARAVELVARARDDARATLSTAEAAAAASIERARADGTRAAEATVRTELIASRRAARVLVLEAQEDVERMARGRAIAAAMAFRERPEYRQLLDNLEASAKHRLGSGVEVERDPPDRGGIRARTEHRSLDYTLASLATTVVDNVLAEMEAPAQTGSTRKGAAT